MTRAVLWDFDGTLATRTGGWPRCLLDALARVEPSLSLTPDDVRPGLRDGFPWHRPEVEHGPRDSAAWWGALAAVLSGAYLRAGVPADVAAAAVAEVRGCYADPAYWTVYDDTLPALRELAAYRHVIVSNHVPELPDLVAALGLPVDAVVTSAAVGWEKPHPAMFRAGLAAAGEPDEVWMVGDNPVADVAGAEAVGIPAVLVRTGGAPDLLGAAAVVLAGPGKLPAPPSRAPL